MALCDELFREQGIVVALVLDALRPGGGQVFHHPEYSSLRSFAHEDLEVSMQEAWDAARELAREEDADMLRDGRWRLMIGDRPVKEVTGQSVSGYVPSYGT